LILGTGELPYHLARPKSRTEHLPDTSSLASDVEMRPIRVDFGANETCGWDHILMRRSGGAHIAVKSGQQKTEPTVRRSGKLLGYAWLSSSAWRWRVPG
jgi:hypothetical protein